MIDLEIGKIPDFISEIIKTPFSIFSFILISCVTIFGQIYLQKFAEKDNEQLVSKSKYINYLSKIAKNVNYIIIANLVLVILSIIFFSKYSVINLLITQNIVAIVGGIILSLLAVKFLTWYFSERDSLVVLFYGIGFMILSTTVFLVYIGENAIIAQKPLLITPMMKVVYPDTEDNFFENFFSIYKYLLTASILLLLIGSYILLSHYATKISRQKLLMGLIISFLFFLLSALDSFNIMQVPNSDESLIIYYLAQALGPVLSGLVFGFAFWTVASKLEPTNPIRKYLMITGSGIIIFFAISQSSLIIGPYPPYALLSVSFVVICAYLINFGLYASAVSLSTDITLRKKIREQTKKNSNLLGSMGTAQMTREIRKAVKDVKEVVDKEEKELEEKTGIETASFSEENVSDYMKQVMQEILAAKKKKIT